MQNSNHADLKLIRQALSVVEGPESTPVALQKKVQARETDFEV
jgi:hypothetical protein